jgi:diguanylate cyclase (GGDEF)-like protein
VTFVHVGVTLPKVTASVGVATASGPLTTPEALVRRADEALYAAKEAGRNRIVAFAATERSTPADG